jgi:hypothetical protein
MIIKRIALIGLVLSIGGSVRADTIPEDQIPSSSVSGGLGVEVQPTIDPRLPPVIPGQEVNVGGGRKVRMISTTGPVTVSSATPPPEIPSNVIVDDRKE